MNIVTTLLAVGVRSSVDHVPSPFVAIVYEPVFIIDIVGAEAGILTTTLAINPADKPLGNVMSKSVIAALE